MRTHYKMNSTQQVFMKFYISTSSIGGIICTDFGEKQSNRTDDLLLFISLTIICHKTSFLKSFASKHVNNKSL